MVAPRASSFSATRPEGANRSRRRPATAPCNSVDGMQDRSDLTAHAASFDQAADVYEASRPGYPAETVEWLVPRAARRVLDLGAGTGKLTRALAASGREVVAVDPSAEMLRVLGEKLPGVEALQGTAEALPLPDASVDAVTVAQAWHWVDTARAVPELTRVLTQGGVLGLVWNSRDERVDWVAELGRAMNSNADSYTASGMAPVVGGPFGEPERIELRWTQHYTREALLELVRSRSYFIVRSAEEQAATLAAVGELLDTHPALAGLDGVELPYVTEAFRYRLEG